MNTHHTATKRENQIVSTQKLFQMEREGRYDEALAQLEELWADEAAPAETNYFPRVADFRKLENFEGHFAAEVLLRVGSLIGFLGHCRQIPDAQESSKNLLTEARGRFLDLLDVAGGKYIKGTEKIAECENYLALGYWRTGELVEAEVWIEESLAHSLPPTSFVRLYSYVIKSLLLLQSGENQEILDLLEEKEIYFLKFGDDCLCGDYHNYLGMALTNLGDASRALAHLESARHYHARAGHRFYLGTVENNIAFLYQKKGLFDEAHRAADHAARLFWEIGDKTREAFALDTKAQIFCAEEKFLDSLQTVDRAIEMLEAGENSGYLVETLQTKIRVLIAVDDIFSATCLLLKAVETAKTKISEGAGMRVLKDFEAALRKYKTVQLSAIYEERKIWREEESFGETSRGIAEITQKIGTFV